MNVSTITNLSFEDILNQLARIGFFVAVSSEVKESFELRPFLKESIQNPFERRLSFLKACHLGIKQIFRLDRIVKGVIQIERLKLVILQQSVIGPRREQEW